MNYNRHSYKMSFNNSKHKYQRLQEKLNLKQRSIQQLYRLAEEAYLKVSQSHRDKWNSIISAVGTRKDKVSMTAAEIIKNPHTCLQKIEELVKWSFDKNNHFALDTSSALVNIFDEYVFVDKKSLKVFAESVQERIKKGNKEKQVFVNELVGFYIEHHIKHFYVQFINSLQNLLTSSISFIKKQAIKMLTSLTKHGELRRMIIASLINKLGDSDREVVNEVYKSLKEEFHQDLQSSSIMLEQAKMLIFRHNISKKTQFYIINLLNNFNMKYLNKKGIEKLFELYYHFFEKLMADQNEKGSVSSRLFLNSIKGLNKIFIFIKSGSKEIKEMISNRIENVYKIVHQSKNTKAKIQLYLFLFQYHSHIHGSLTDRYYRSLYDFIKHDQVLSSSLAEVFFDLLLISIKQDQNLNRKMAFLKRILQICFSAQANFIATTLLMINNIVQQSDALKIKLKKKQNEMGDQEGKEQIYDINKREPIYAGAQNVLVWELTVFNNHYHPTVRKYALQLIKGQQINYEGQNPILELSSSNFLQKLIMKKQKKSQAWMLKMKKHLKKIRSAKYESLVNKNQNDFNDDQEFIKKYLKMRNNIHTNFKKKQGTDIQQYADRVIQNQMDRLNAKNEQIEFLSDPQAEGDNQQPSLEENQEIENYQSLQEQQFEDNMSNSKQSDQYMDEENVQQSYQDASDNGSQDEKEFQEAFQEIDNESIQYPKASKKIIKQQRQAGRKSLKNSRNVIRNKNKRRN